MTTFSSTTVASGQGGGPAKGGEDAVGPGEERGGSGGPPARSSESCSLECFVKINYKRVVCILVFSNTMLRELTI